MEASSDPLLERAEIFARMRESQRLTNETLLTGRVPVHAEIDMRVMMADGALMCCASYGPDPSMLQEAIQHLEVVLRKMPEQRMEYVACLDKLSHASFSRYLLDGTFYALETAVTSASKAVELARTLDLQEHNLELCIKTLQSLSSALSHRYAQRRQDGYPVDDDLDIAIASMLEVSALAERGSDAHAMSLNNLASQLSRRFEQSQDEDDINMAEIYLRELLELPSSNPLQEGMTYGQMGFVLWRKYQHTLSEYDLMAALQNTRKGLDLLPDHHEKATDAILLLIKMHEAKRKVHGGEGEQEELVHYTFLYLDTESPSHWNWPTILLEYIENLLRLMKIHPSEAELGTRLPDLEQKLGKLDTNHEQREKCQIGYTNLLGIQYLLSNDFRHLLRLASYSLTTIEERNLRVKKPGSRLPTVESEWIKNFVRHLTSIGHADENSSMGQLVQEDLLGGFVSLSMEGKAAILTLKELYDTQHLRVEVFADALDRGQDLCEAEVDTAIMALKQRYLIKPKGPSGSQLLKALDQTFNALGLRPVAVNPETKNVYFDMGELARDKFGYGSDMTYEEYLAMEPVLEQEAIQAVKSQGRSPNLDLCRICRDIIRPLRPNEDHFELTAQNCTLPFGDFLLLRGRQQCAFCRLVLAGLTSKIGELYSLLNNVDRALQGTRLSVGSLSSGERVMRVDYGERHVCDIRIITSENTRSALRQSHELSTDTSVSSEERSLRFQNFAKSARQTVDLTLIKRWLNTCDQMHGSSCNSARSDHLASFDMPLILIDVVQECLVAKSTKEKYFTLSYVWGRVDMYKTVQDNFQSRQEPQGIAEVPFPKTIKDAMRCVQGLGGRYLWIDALCIVQDDAGQMGQHIQRMNVVYGKSFATIVALDGENADSGLPGIRPYTRPPQHTSTIYVSRGSVSLDSGQTENSEVEINLTVTPPALHLVRDDAVWSSRGWVYQEYLLSLRCIYFTAKAVYFQCGSRILCEGGINEDYDAKLFDTVDLKDDHIRKQADFTNPLKDVDAMYFQALPERMRWRFRTYRTLIEMYSPKEFTSKSDILRGFAGVFSVLERHFNGEIIFGLPVKVFNLALLWSPATRMPRRGCRLPTVEDRSIGKSDVTFPSWSWCGWDGAVEYRLFDEIGGGMELPLSQAKWFKIGRGSNVRIIETGREMCGFIDDARMKAIEAESEIVGSIADPDSTTQSTESEAKSSDFERNSDGALGGSKKDQDNAHGTLWVVGDNAHGTSWVVGGPQATIREPWDDPLESTILTFEALTLPVNAFRLSPEKLYLSRPSNIHSASPQAVRRVYDTKGCHCGLWWEQAGYGYVGLDAENDHDRDRNFHFVNLAYYGGVYHARKGPMSVEGELEMFDSNRYPAIGPGSGLVNALVVIADLDNAEAVGFRCTVALIHSCAWLEAKPEKKKFQIA